MTYPRDYMDARSRFTSLAQAVGLTLESHDSGLFGPGPDAAKCRLTTDVAISDGLERQHTLLITTGLHGVEGYFGSAVLTRFLELGREKLPECRSVFVHALNPYGFAYDRRFNEENVDLNRNFLLDHERYVGSPPMYAELDPLLNPTVPPSSFDGFLPRAIGYIARGGMPKLQRAVAEGQYEFPCGLFYGGRQPGWANKFMREQLPRLLGNSTRVTHIDLHTGLGKWATWQLLLDVAPTGVQREWLNDVVGESGFLCADSESAHYRARGSLGRWAVSEQLASDYLYLCAEFGTYSPVRVLSALRRENQAHHYSEEGSGPWRKEKQRLREVFCPTNAAWRKSSVDNAVKLLQAAAIRPAA